MCKKYCGDRKVLMSLIVRSFLILGALLFASRSFAIESSCTSDNPEPVYTGDNRGLSGRDQFLLNELNDQTFHLFDKYYCLNPRTYFNQLNHVMEVYKTHVNSPSAVEILNSYRKRYKLPPISSDNTDYLLGGDKRRIQKFSFHLEKFRRISKLANLPPLNGNLKNYQIVLVAGWGNEFFRSTYFEDWVYMLREHFGLPAQQVHQIFPNSEKSVSANGFDLEVLLNNIFETGRPVILIGHSMGGNILINLLLNRPELIANPLVHKVITLQSPLRGTPVANLLNEIENSAYGFLKLFRLTKCSDCAAGSAAFSMRPTEATGLIAKALKNISEKLVSELDRKVFYITSWSGSQRTKIGTYVIDGRNDGTVPLINQYIRSFGRRLAQLPNVGHTDLVIGGIKSDLTQNERRAFVYTLFDQLVDPMTDKETEF